MSQQGRVYNTFMDGMKIVQKKEEAVHERACIVVALQLLNNCVNGSPYESVVPPVLTGTLRGSGSVFVDGKFIGEQLYKGQGTPSRDWENKHTGPGTQIGILFNTAYAHRMHETDWEPGPKSQADGKDVGNKWVTRHLENDAPELMNLYGIIIKKEVFDE